MRRILSSSQYLVPGPAPLLVLAGTITASTSSLAPARTSCSPIYFILNLFCSLPYLPDSLFLFWGEYVNTYSLTYEFNLAQMHTACSWKMSAMATCAITLNKVELVLCMHVMNMSICSHISIVR